MIPNRILFMLSVAVSLANTASAHAGDTDTSAYIQFGIGTASSENATFKDDVCDGPPATLFGCGVGNDGRPLGAYGDFGTSVLIDGGIGLWLQDWLRAEATVSYRPDLDFNRTANFTQTNADQPVTTSTSPGIGLPASAYRYSNLGYVRTDPGNIAVVVPPADPLLIPVRETRAPLSVYEILFSLRYEFATR